MSGGRDTAPRRAGDGLNNLMFDVLERRIIQHDNRVQAGPWVQARVRFRFAPTAEQAAALPPVRG